MSKTTAYRVRAKKYKAAPKPSIVRANHAVMLRLATKANIIPVANQALQTIDRGCLGTIDV